MKKARITITHQLDKTQHHFMVVYPDKLIRLKKEMGVEMVFVNGSCINEKGFNFNKVKPHYFKSYTPFWHSIIHNKSKKHSSSSFILV
jgi:hypothetical protein